MHAGQEGGANTSVSAGGLTLKRERRTVVEPGNHDQPILERGERLQNRRQLERSVGRRRPLVHHRAVRHIDDAEPRLGLGGRLAHSRQRGDHAVEKGQREHRTQTA